MGFRLVAFTHTDAAGIASLTACPTVTDDSITKIDTNHYKLPSQNLLLGAYGMGASLTRFQVKTPSLSGNNRVPIEVDEVDQSAATLVSKNFPPFQDYSKTPVPLVAGEGIEVDYISSAAAQVSFCLWLGDGQISYVSGQFLPGVRATSATIQVANAWTNCTLTFDNQLPAGGYAVVGMEAFSATANFARLVFPELGPRPGVLAGTQPSIRAKTWRGGSFRSASVGQMVNWGSFAQDSPPSVDFFAGAADVAQTVLLDLVKIA